jgi:hypothetical protein
LEENKWGEPAWIDEVKKLQTFAKTRCITNFVKHMVMEAKKCYANTHHENTYLIYHNALTQITHESCVKWMKMTYVPGEIELVYSRYINPLNGLNDSFVRQWAGRLLGNTPKVMPLNNSLFWDMKESVQKHVAMSLTICNPGVKDDRFFLTATSKDAWHAYSWVFDPQSRVAPTSNQIVKDIQRLKIAWWKIFKAKGVYVPGLAGGRTPGIPHIETTGSNRGGGKHVRHDFFFNLDMLQMHDDLLQAMDEHGGDITSKICQRG